MDGETGARIRAKKYLKLLRQHVDMMEEIIHMLAEEYDHIPPEVELELADAVRHYKAMKDALLAADRRLRAM